MHDPKNENDTSKEVRRAIDDAPERREPAPRDDRTEDGRRVTERAVAKQEKRALRADERASEAGSLGTGIGDDRPGGAPPREGEPD